MRLTILLLTVALLNVQATGLSQTVTLSGRDISLRKVFSVIREQTGYVVFGNNSLFVNTTPVSVNVTNMPLTNFLNLVLKDQPLTYTIDGKTIFIAANTLPAAKPETDKPVFELFPDQGREIWGRLTNLSGEPLGGASITIKRNKKGTTTNSSGIFNLKGVESTDTLICSFIGYKTREVIVGDKNEIAIVLAVAENQLDQVIIQAYGTTTRRTGVGAITKVSGEEIARQNVMNPLMALQGRVPGLVITPQSGHVSGKIKLEIRGRRALSSNFTNEPLIVIDGMPMTVIEMNQGAYESGSGGVNQGMMPGPAGGQNILFGLNPSDIESIEVLRDADATAIYGSRGANGVIMVTTKKGSTRGGSKFNFSVNQGLNMVTSHWKMMNTRQYVQVRKEAFENDGLPINASTAPDLAIWDTTRYTDWQRELWGGKGKTTMINASLAGGNEQTTYRFSSSFNKSTDILTKSGANQVATFGLNVGHVSLNRKFRIDFSGFYSKTKVDLIALPDPTLLAPNAPPMYTAEGLLNWKDYNDAGLPDAYLFGSINNSFVSKTGALTATLGAQYDILKNLKASSSIGYGTSDNNSLGKYPISSFNPLYSPTGSAYQSATNILNWKWQGQLDYLLRIGQGKLTAMVGATYQSNETKTNTQLGMGYTNDAFLESIQLAPFPFVFNDRGQYKYIGTFARLNFNWDNKYILNLNGNRDGSSRFGLTNRFGNFGSVGASWLATEESWVKRWMPEIVSLVKFRATYGLTASDNVGNYDYLSQWSGTISNNVLLPYDGVNPLVKEFAENPDYFWQATKKLDLGVSLGLLNDRIIVEFTQYIERVDDQLTNFPTPIITGFRSVTANWPATIKNTGIELNISGRVIDQKDFKLGFNFNISRNRNILHKYPDFEQSPYYTQYQIGHSLNAVYLLRYIGVDPQTGQYTYQDANKDGYNGNVRADQPIGRGYDDRVVVYDLAPKYIGGFGFNTTYKRFDVNLYFHYSRRYSMNPIFPTETFGHMVNMSSELFGNYWQKPGDIKRFAAPTTNGGGATGNFRNSDGAYYDLKFLRLASVNVNYMLPEKVLNKMKLSSCSVFLKGQNLFFISNSEGVDPEAQSAGTLPMSRVITAGISLSL